MRLTTPNKIFQEYSSLALHLREPGAKERILELPGHASAGEILSQEVVLFEYFQGALHGGTWQTVTAGQFR